MNLTSSGPSQSSRKTICVHLRRFNLPVGVNYLHSCSQDAGRRCPRRPRTTPSCGQPSCGSSPRTICTDLILSLRVSGSRFHHSAQGELHVRGERCRSMAFSHFLVSQINLPFAKLRRIAHSLPLTTGVAMRSPFWSEQREPPSQQARISLERFNGPLVQLESHGPKPNRQCRTFCFAL